MRRKSIAFILAFLLCVTGSYIGTASASAAEITEGADISNVWTEDALVGYATLQTRGIYLLEGVSVINDAGNDKIGAGGITNAAIRCKVSVNVIVEKKENGTWYRETSWSATKTSALSVGTDKEISVDSGYYYRVRSIHSASTDTSSSCTSSLWM